MKKILLIAYISFCFMHGAAAQQYLEVYGGPSLPLGDYGHTGNGGPGSYADVGRSFGLHYGRLLMEYAGIGAELTYSTHSVGQGEATKDLGLQTFRQEPFTNIFAGVGVAFDFPVADRLNIGGKSMLGMMNVSMSERAVQYSDGSTATLEAQSSASFTFKLGTALRYELTDHLSASFALDLTDGNPKFEEGDRENVRRNFTFLDPRFGLIYYFGQRTEKTAY